MALPTITLYGENLGSTYSGDIATSRYTAKHTNGTVFTVDVIQSLPNKLGRWRHVIRSTWVSPPAVAGAAPLGRTYTLTMDHPASFGSSDVASEVRDLFAAISPALDEIALGQQ